MPGVTLVVGASVDGRRSTLSLAEQAAGGGSEAAENSLLEPVGDGLKQKSPANVDRRFGAIEHPPALLEGRTVEPAEVGERAWVAAFHVRPPSPADLHIALVGLRSQSFSGSVQPHRSALTKNRKWQEMAAFARNERDRRFRFTSLRQANMATPPVSKVELLTRFGTRLQSYIRPACLASDEALALMDFRALRSADQSRGLSRPCVATEFGSAGLTGSPSASHKTP